MMSSQEVYDLLRDAGYDACPSWRHLPTTHWVMGPEWYKAIRRASLQPACDDDDDATRRARNEARDETKWEPQHGDTALGYYITVTEDGGRPHLADGR